MSAASHRRGRRIGGRRARPPDNQHGPPAVSDRDPGLCSAPASRARAPARPTHGRSRRLHVPLFDLPLAELRAYAPDLAEPADLDAFWSATIADARGHNLAASFQPTDSGLTVVESFDVTYAGFGGQ